MAICRWPLAAPSAALAEDGVDDFDLGRADGEFAGKAVPARGLAQFRETSPGPAFRGRLVDRRNAGRRRAEDEERAGETPRRAVTAAWKAPAAEGETDEAGRGPRVSPQADRGGGRLRR